MICACTLCSFLVLATFSLWGCDPDEPSPPADQAVPDGPVDKLDGSVDRAAPDKKLPDASLPDQVLPDQVLPDQMLPDMPPPQLHRWQEKRRRDRHRLRRQELPGLR